MVETTEQGKGGYKSSYHARINFSKIHCIPKLYSIKVVVDTLGNLDNLALYAFDDKYNR